MSPWQVALEALKALTPAAMALLDGDERAAVVAAKKAMAKQAIRAMAAAKKARK